VVAAWFESVINPLIRTLKNEQAYLTRGVWTWKSYPGSLTELTHLCSHQPHFYVSENQEQLLEQHPSLGDALRKHDEEVDNFRDCIAGLHEAVMTSRELELIYRDKTSPTSLQALRDAFPQKLGGCQDEAAVMRDLFVGPDMASHLDVLARHITNNEHDLGVGFITTAPLWNTYRPEFLSVLATPALSELKAQLEDSRGRLETAVNDLADQLTETRRGLARRYNVPYTEPARLPGFGGWQEKY
jgi:hypothetical protein